MMLVLSGKWKIRGVATTPGWKMYVVIAHGVGGSTTADSLQIVPGQELGTVEGPELEITFSGSFSTSTGTSSSEQVFVHYSPDTSYRWVASKGLRIKAFLSDDDIANLGLTRMEVVLIQDDEDTPSTTHGGDFTVPKVLVSSGS